MARIYAIAAAAVAAAVVGGSAGYVWFNRGSDPYAECRQGQAGGAAIGGPFTLLDKTGATVTDADVIKGPTLVYFGYTFCPDVCPLDMSRNAEVVDAMAEQGKKLGLVFISVDPARDTPLLAGEFAQNIHPDAIGLSGSAGQVAAAAKAYKAYYKAHEDGTDYYLVDHSAFTYLMLPGGELLDFYRHDAPADEMAKGVSCFLDRVAQEN
jgi:protein SCO1/2